MTNLNGLAKSETSLSVSLIASLPPEERTAFLMSLADEQAFL
jgi:hypothetical protein